MPFPQALMDIFRQLGIPIPPGMGGPPPGTTPGINPNLPHPTANIPGMGGPGMGMPGQPPMGGPGGLPSPGPGGLDPQIAGGANPAEQQYEAMLRQMLQQQSAGPQQTLLSQLLGFIPGVGDDISGFLDKNTGIQDLIGLGAGAAAGGGRGVETVARGIGQRKQRELGRQQTQLGLAGELANLEQSRQERRQAAEEIALRREQYQSESDRRAFDRLTDMIDRGVKLNSKAVKSIADRLDLRPEDLQRMQEGVQQKAVLEQQKTALTNLNSVLRTDNPNRDLVNRLAAQAGILQPGEELLPEELTIMRMSLDKSGNLIPVEQGGFPVEDLDQLLDVMAEVRRMKNLETGGIGDKIRQVEAAIGRPLTEEEKSKAGLEELGINESGQRPLTQNAEANIINRLTTQWDKATEQIRELQRQQQLMNIGLNAAKKGDMAAGSQAVLVTFQKILDPTSVVRESEYARSSEGLSLLNRVQGAYDRLLKGGAGVPVQELEAFERLAREAVEKLSSEGIGAVRDRIEKTADRYNIPHDVVLTEYNLGPGQEKSGETTTYKFTAVNPQTGERMGSNDGVTWVKIP